MPRKQHGVGSGAPSSLCFLALWAVVSAACEQTGDGSTSDNSHFLYACAEGCGDDLTCVCGVCTVECTSNGDCEGLAARASCSPEGAGICDGRPQSQACEVNCASDANCSHLGREHRCVEGTCRADAEREEAGVLPRDAGTRLDAGGGSRDAGLDGGRLDAGFDAGRLDAGFDAGRLDAGRTDASAEAGARDAGGSNDAQVGDDASRPVRCGDATCADGEVCCDHCSGRCVSALSGALCPDDTDPNRTCEDSGTAECAPALGSCVSTACCPGLKCCSGVPFPQGTAVCYEQTCPISDRGQKTGFADIDHEAVLERVLALPISSWRYKHEPETISHIGPMAQDFKASFGVGADDKHIFPLDEGGVSLAAIQALHKKLTELEDQQAKLRQENNRMQSELTDLRRRLSKR